MSVTSGWTWRAPKLMTGSGAAASTHSRAAVAQPVDWASIPSIAVSYRPNWRYRARMRRTTSLGAMRSPSASASRRGLAVGRPGQHVGEQDLGLVDAAQDARRAGRRPPWSRPGRAPRPRRISSARAKYTSAESPDRISRDGRVRCRPIGRSGSSSASGVGHRARVPDDRAASVAHGLRAVSARRTPGCRAPWWSSDGP